MPSPIASPTAGSNPPDATEPAPIARRRLVIFAASLACIGIAWLLPSPEPYVLAGKSIALTESGRLALGVLAMVIVLWITEVVAFPIAGFIAIVLIHALGVQDFNTTLARGFGHPVVGFVLGVFFLSLAVTRSGLGPRMAGVVLGRVGRNPRHIVFAFMGAGALLASGISDGAVAAILMPIAVAVLRAEGVAPLRSNFGRALMIACAWGPAIGGISTPAGTASNAISLSYLHSIGGVSRGFVDWLCFGVPAALLLLPVACVILMWIFPPEMRELAHSPAQALPRPGRMSRAEWTTLAVIAATVAGWIGAPAVKSAIGLELSIEYVAFAGVLVFFLPGLDVLAWDDVQREFPWSALFLVMTGISIGFVIGDTGAAEWLACGLIKDLGSLPLYVAICGTALMVCLLHNLFVSNTVTTVVLLPIVLHAALLLGVPPWLAAAPAAFLATMGLILVTTAPTNVIPYTAGYFSLRDFAKAGIVLSVVGPILIGTVIYAMHVLFGFQ